LPICSLKIHKSKENTKCPGYIIGNKYSIQREGFLMKKWVIVFVLLLEGGGILSIKYYTSLLDSKDSAIIINKHFSFKDDYQDIRTLTKAVDHIFIGEVIREVGTEQYTGHPNTQFLVRITQNIKGALLGDITVKRLPW
jgi:hypothetical protein